MSEWVYEFKEPVTSVRLDDNGGHVTVTVFVNGKQSGKLVVTSPQASGPERRELRSLMECFMDRRVARFWRGGAGEEDVVEWDWLGEIHARGDYFLVEPQQERELLSTISREELKAMREIKE